MNKINNLTQGTILRALFLIAIPLILSSFVQMAYNLTDLAWLGRLGSECVAAVGAAGYFMWTGNALALLAKTAAEISISQSIGAQDLKKAQIYAKQSYSVALIIGFLFAVFIFFAADFLIGLFHFPDAIAKESATYLRLVSPAIFFNIVNGCFTGIYNGTGNTKIPFRIVASGLLINIALDPLFIYGWGFIPAMRAAGAGIATSLAQVIVFIIFVSKTHADNFSLGSLKGWATPKLKYVNRILHLGAPIALENGLFSLFSVTLSSYAARWGHQAVATFSLGSQIEAITWMTANGLSTALGAFVGQNFGAGNWARLSKGYRMILLTGIGIGLFNTLIFIFFGKTLFSLFLSDPITIAMGRDYMFIIAFSQIFMLTEAITRGAFNGIGDTVPASLNGIIFTGMRIPMAFAITAWTALGVNGIWWTISISSIIKGIVLPAIYAERIGKVKQNRTSLEEYSTQHT